MSKMKGKKPEEIKSLEKLAREYNYKRSMRSEEEKEEIREAFGGLYERVHTHDGWSYWVLEKEDINWSWDALEKTDVSPEPRRVYEILNEFAETPNREREFYEDLDRKNKEDREYLRYVRKLLGLTKDASKRFVQRTKKHFGETQTRKLMREEYKKDVLNNVIDYFLKGNLPGSDDIIDTLDQGKYVFKVLNKRIPKLTELEPLVQEVLKNCADKAPFPSGRRGNEYHSYEINVKKSGSKDYKRIETDYSVALAVGLYQLTKIKPTKQLINSMVKRRINGASYLRNIEKIGRVGERNVSFFGPITGIDGLLGGICSDVLNNP